MKKIQCFIFFALITIIAGCVNSKARPFPAVPYFKELIKHWTGKPLNELIRKWGPPQKTYRAGNVKYVVYNLRMRYWGGAGRTDLFEMQDEVCTYKFVVSRRNIIISGTAMGYTCPLYKDEITRGVIPGTTRPNSKYRDR